MDELYEGLACISIAVPSIDEYLPVYRDQLGFEVTSDVRQSQRFGLRWLEFGLNGRTCLELLEPTDDDGLVARFLERNGPGVYQVRFEVSDLARTVNELSGRGNEMIESAHVSGQPEVGWVHPRSTGGVLFELVEKGHGQVAADT